ncbi:unnamed protein product [Paramecium sonneborni]|uniref:Uncharacterized protein n=1 Tax=Paramecium sonneborni TaxID=65129 RepID=A0A8S1RVD2_9CILI|nr:unnamed protein product [Paramecium sonneborni]
MLQSDLFINLKIFKITFVYKGLLELKRIKKSNIISKEVQQRLFYLKKIINEYAESQFQYSFQIQSKESIIIQIYQMFQAKLQDLMFINIGFETEILETINKTLKNNNRIKRGSLADIKSFIKQFESFKPKFQLFNQDQQCFYFDSCINKINVILFHRLITQIHFFKLQS